MSDDRFTPSPNPTTYEVVGTPGQDASAEAIPTQALVAALAEPDFETFKATLLAQLE